jgi:hypothetical protein
MIHGSRITTFCIAIFFSLSFAVSAGEVTGLIEFEDKTPADADEVNANFNAVKKAVDENYQKILTYSETRNGSVTFSAMGFSPDRSKASGLGHATEFEKAEEFGFLLVSEEEGGYFYHTVTLRTGVNITQIRANFYDGDSEDEVSAVVKLRKKIYKNQVIIDVATLTWNGLGVTETGEGFSVKKLENPEYIEWSSSGYPPSYFIEAKLGNTRVGLFSVTIDYTYTEP